MPKKRPPSPEEIRRAQLESDNGLILYDRVGELITASLTRGAGSPLTKDLVREFHAIATAGIESQPGTFRPGRVYITNSEHRPPPADEVPALVDQCSDYLQREWSEKDAIHLAAYVLWRLNWIHPFEDGNGRVARAARYLVLCCRSGHVLGGTKTIPEMIVANRRRYYEALVDADVAWRGERISVEALERLIQEYLARQVQSG